MTFLSQDRLQKSTIETCEQISHVRLLDKGLRLRKEKGGFRQKSCKYLGHIIDEEGIHPTYYNVIAINNAPVPQNVPQLRSYLGLIHYYHTFLSNTSNLLAPLHELTRLDTEWKWERYTRTHLSSRRHCCLRLRCWRTMTLSYPLS